MADIRQLIIKRINNQMSGYLLSLLGVIILGVLVDVILPSGSTSKYISGIFAIVVMFVMISPVLTWIKNDYKISDYFTSTEIQLNDKLLYDINQTKFSALEQDIEQELTTNGYNNVDIDIQFELVADNVTITKVLADINNLVINENVANINRYVYIRQVVMSHIAVTQEVIEFSE
ncbi:MAG: stage III sporulation protein AF [Clostridia bacterium]|nr:stage III sporulation protein AF [Clostridia bacterium]